MEDDLPVYGLDIETDTSRGGLDPRRAGVLAVALSDGRTDRVFTGAEAFLLARVDEVLAELAPGVLATWNGAAFDLPFLADRARRLAVPLGLRLVPDPGLVVRTAPLPGHAGAYRASWHGHTHLDAYRLHRADPERAPAASCSLKAVARRAGLSPVEVDRGAVHQLGLSELAAYVASDARLTRALALRRSAEARRFVDAGHGAPPARPADARPVEEVAVG